MSSFAFGASSTLAKQVEAGAPADLFASADRKWMDYLGNRGRIDRVSRIDLLGNTLVLIAPKGRRIAAKTQAGFRIADAFKGDALRDYPKGMLQRFPA